MVIPNQDEKTVEPLYFDTYLAVVRNSVGANSFKNFYALVSGERKDILEDGRLSCAYFVSSVLHQFQLIKTPHTGINGTVSDMEDSGWIKIAEPREGAVVLWEEREDGRGERHKHIGFYVGNDTAISNSEAEGMLVAHHWTYNGEREAEAIYWCLEWK
jgi:hypothetical protein